MPALRTHHPLAPAAFLAPAALVLGVFFAGSLAQVVYLSFTRYTAFNGPDWVGLDNYTRLLASGRFWGALLNSGLYLLVTPAIIVLSLLAALAVDVRLRGMSWLRLALFLPVVTPTIVAALMWRLLYNEDSGVLNAALRAAGFEGIRWLTERPWTLISAALVTLWKGFGFYMMVFLAALAAVPRELREAAALDGASRTQIFWAVTFPSIRPAIVLVFVISSISALKVFEELFVTIKGAPISHQTVVPLIYRVAFEEGNYGMASAIGIALFVVILVFSIVQLKLTSRGGS
ncbi:MAG TPA: sugar ABC transporter permease [Phycisphaerales bacterium]